MKDVADAETNYQQVQVPGFLHVNLSHQGGGSGALVLPGWRQNSLGLVISGQSVDSALNQNESELGILVLPVSLKMLSDGDCLLDQIVAVLGQSGSHSLAFQDTENLVAGDKSDLGNSMTVSEDDTNLRWSQTLLGQLVDLVLDLIGGQLQPGWN